AAARRHGIDSVQDQVYERLTQFTFAAGDFGQVLFKVRPQLHNDAPGLRVVAPARSAHFLPRSGEPVQIYRRQGILLLAATIELAHATDDVGDIFAGGLDVLKVFEGVFGKVRVVLQQEVGIDDDGTKGIVDVMGD